MPRGELGDCGSVVPGREGYLHQPEVTADLLDADGWLHADDIVLALNEVATNAILYGSRGGQPVQVVVHVNDDVIEASVLDHGPDPPAQPPTDADTDALGVRGRGCGCCAGSWMRCGLSASGSGPA